MECLFLVSLLEYEQHSKIMKIPFFLTYLSLALSLSAASDWTPTFDDEPVPPAQIEAIEKAVPKAPIVEPKAGRRVLVFSATAGFRHKSIPYGKVAFEKMGQSSGAYQTVISDDPKNFELEALQEFDAVILLSPTQDFLMPSRKNREDFPEEEWQWLQARHNRLVDNLTEYVKQGGGLVGIHAATDACYNHKDYPSMIGGLFDGHPWNAGNNVTIVVEDPEHAINKPVFEAMKDFRIKEEIYQFRAEPYSREKLRILLHLDPERSDQVEKMKRKDNDYPVAWVQSFGEGRVFYSTLGHNKHIFQNTLILRHFLAGIQFATGDLEADTTPSALIDP